MKYNIKSLRRGKGIDSQGELARLLSNVIGHCVDTTTICKHETGTRNPTQREIIGYGLILEVPTWQLYRDIISL